MYIFTKPLYLNGILGEEMITKVYMEQFQLIPVHPMHVLLHGQTDKWTG